MPHRPAVIRRTVAAVLVCAIAPAAWAHQPAHVHGQAQLDVFIDGNRLGARLESPLDNLLGFEHRPRTAAQKQAAEAALAKLRDVGSWLVPPAAAGCTAAAPTIDDSALQPAPEGAHEGDAEKHADLDAEVSFECTTPAALTTLEVRLFEAFPRMKRIDVQVAGPDGQHKRRLRTPATTLKLGR